MEDNGVVRALVILIVTSGATVVCTWICTKFHLGFLTAWLLAAAIIFFGAVINKGKNSY